MELGASLGELRTKRSQNLILAGEVMLVCALAGYLFWPQALVLAAPGLGLLVVGAKTPPVVIHERAILRGDLVVPYDAVRLARYDGSIWLTVMYEPIVAARAPERMRDVLQDRVLPAVLAAWRARLDAGDEYTLVYEGATVFELDARALRVHVPGREGLAEIPVEELRIEGRRAYIGDELVTDLASLDADLILRQLLASRGVTVT